MTSKELFEEVCEKISKGDSCDLAISRDLHENTLIINLSNYGVILTMVFNEGFIDFWLE